MGNRGYTWQRNLMVYWHSLRLQVRAAMSLRGAFAIQVIGMVLNNSAIIVAWLFLFRKFGTINGWGPHELIGLQGVNMVIFGVMMLLSEGILNLDRYVDRGTLDGMLTKPMPVLLQIAGNHHDPTTFGDFLLGVGITAWYVLTSHPTAIKFVIFVLLWCFTLLPCLLAFYIFDSAQVSHAISFAFLDSGLYPTGVLTGVLRGVLLTLIPGLFIGAVPLEVLYRFGWPTVLLGVPVAAFWLFITLRLFRRALRRYESSNLVGAR